MKKYNIFFVLVFFCGASIKAGVDQKPSYQGWSQALGNIFSAGKNSCLGPSSFNISLRKELRNNKNLMLSFSDYRYDAGLEKPVHAFVKVDNKETKKSYFIFAPAHDVSPEGEKKTPILGLVSGNFPLYKALKVLFTSYKKDKKATVSFIPLILTGRKHWVLLEIRGNWSERIIDVSFIDSKGPHALVFSVDHLKKAFSDSPFGQDGFSIRWKNYQLGHQGLLNRTDCGYFVTEYLLKLLYGESVADLKTQKITVKKRR